jgi:hypothetical protein
MAAETGRGGDGVMVKQLTDIQVRKPQGDGMIIRRIQSIATSTGYGVVGAPID